jgi:hypothetical protein
MGILRTVVMFVGIVVVLTGSLAAQAMPSKASSSILGTVDKGQYINQYLGFSLTIPKGWVVADNETSSAMLKIGQDVLKSDSERDNRAFEESIRKGIVLLNVTKKPVGAAENAVFALSVQKQPSPHVTPAMVAEATKSIFDRTPALKLVKDTRIETIAGRKFALLDYEMSFNGEVVGVIRCFITMVKGFSLSFSLSYLQSGNSGELEDIVRSLKFTDK